MFCVLVEDNLIIQMCGITAMSATEVGNDDWKEEKIGVNVVTSTSLDGKDR